MKEEEEEEDGWMDVNVGCPRWQFGIFGGSPSWRKCRGYLLERERDRDRVVLASFVHALVVIHLDYLPLPSITFHYLSSLLAPSLLHTCT